LKGGQGNEKKTRIKKKVTRCKQADKTRSKGMASEGELYGEHAYYEGEEIGRLLAGTPSLIFTKGEQKPKLKNRGEIRAHTLRERTSQPENRGRETN